MNNIKRCVKRAKENWMGERCSEVEDNLRKNKKKEGIPTGETLDLCETGESNYCPRPFRKMPHKRATDTEPMDRLLL